MSSVTCINVAPCQWFQQCRRKRHRTRHIDAAPFEVSARPHVPDLACPPVAMAARFGGPCRLCNRPSGRSRRRRHERFPHERLAGGRRGPRHHLPRRRESSECPPSGCPPRRGAARRGAARGWPELRLPGTVRRAWRRRHRSRSPCGAAAFALGPRQAGRARSDSPPGAGRGTQVELRKGAASSRQGHRLNPRPTRPRPLLGARPNFART